MRSVVGPESWNLLWNLGKEKYKKRQGKEERREKLVAKKREIWRKKKRKKNGGRKGRDRDLLRKEDERWDG